MSEVSDSVVCMADPTIRVTDEIGASTEALLSTALNDFNLAATGVADHRPLAVLVTDPGTQQVVGGLTGRTSLGMLFVDYFYLPPELRGSGLGGEVLRQAENEGRARGCRTGVLYTISFQAPGFYQKNGWRVFGDLPCNPPGTSRIYLTKEL